MPWLGPQIKSPCLSVPFYLSLFFSPIFSSSPHSFVVHSHGFQGKAKTRGAIVTVVSSSPRDNVTVPTPTALSLWCRDKQSWRQMDRRSECRDSKGGTETESEKWFKVKWKFDHFISALVLSCTCCDPFLCSSSSCSNNDLAFYTHLLLAAMCVCVGGWGEGV